MSQSNFHSIAQQAMQAVDETLGELDPERLDVDWAGDVMQLCFNDGVVFVLNAHSAAQQIWLAAGTSAWHFDPPAPPESDWVAAKSNEALREVLSKVVGEKLGVSIPWGT